MILKRREKEREREKRTTAEENEVTFFATNPCQTRNPTQSRCGRGVAVERRRGGREAVLLDRQPPFDLRGIGRPCLGLFVCWLGWLGLFL